MNNPMHALAGLICDKFIAADAVAAARALETLPVHQILLLLGPLKAQSIIAALNPMDPPKAAAVLRRLPFKQAGYVLMRLEVEQSGKLWKEFSVPYRERLQSALPENFIALISGAGQYAPDSIARWMSTDCVLVKTDAALSVLVEKLKTLPRKKIPAECFVVGKDGELKGMIRSAETAFYEPQSVCGSIMTPVKSLHPADTCAAAAALFAAEQTAWLPVVDAQNKVVGALARVALPAAEEKSFWKRLMD